MSALETWMAGYMRAWASNSPADIRALFTDDAVLRNEPYTPAFVGADSIVDEWLRRRDEAGSYTFAWQPLSVTAEVAVVTGTITYAAGPTYSNLWVIRLADDGRATEFTEWWMDHANPS